MKRCVVVDFEMNPVAKANREARRELGCEIIEIGAVRLDESHTVVDRFSCFVSPQYNKEITSYITDLTGISRYETYNAPFFGEALKRFEDWIGYGEPSAIYSWSDTDRDQLEKECAFKRIALPENMRDWNDFQAEYMDAMQYTDRGRQMALHTAAEQFGIGMDSKRIHSALYDAEITAELLIAVRTGAYLRQAELLRGAGLQDPEDRGCSIGDCFGGIFQELLGQNGGSGDDPPEGQ